MAQADHGPGSAKPADLLWRHGAGRDRHHQRGQRLCRIAQQRQIGLGHRPDQGRVMRPLAPWVQMRPLQMQSKKPRHALAAGRNPRCDDLGNGLGRIGDQRGQQARRAKLGMGGADMGQGVGIRRAIHGNSAAPIDLQIDQPRRKDAPVQPHS